MRNTVKTNKTYHVLLTEVKAHLNIETDFTEDDSYITQLMQDATELAENYIDGEIANTDLVTEIYQFSGNCIELLATPLQSITSITYLDEDDVTEVPVTEFKIRKGSNVNNVILDESISTERVTISYKAGYVAAVNVPLNINRAILLKSADLYDVNRGSMVSRTFKDSGAFFRMLDYHKKIYW